MVNVRRQPRKLGVWMRLIVSRGAGFIGSAAVCRACMTATTYSDMLTYAGRCDALVEVLGSPVSPCK
jgi:dTDP-D-glucose 4,6-dehydratase